MLSSRTTPHGSWLKISNNFENTLGSTNGWFLGAVGALLLSLVYAETHPDRVKALILRGLFMCREQELQWFYQEGTSRLFPEAFETYREFIPKEEQGDLISAYYKRLTSEDKDVRLEAAKHWSVWGRLLFSTGT